MVGCGFQLHACTWCHGQWKMFSEEERKKAENAVSTLVSFNEKVCSSQAEDLSEPGSSGSCRELRPNGEPS